MLLDLERTAAERSAGVTARGPTVQLFVEECLLFAGYIDRLVGEGARTKMCWAPRMGGTSWRGRTGESSHQGVEMVSNGKTPIQ